MRSLKDNTGALYRSQTVNHITIKFYLWIKIIFWHWMMSSLLPFMVSVVLNKNSKWSLPMTDIFFACLRDIRAVYIFVVDPKRCIKTIVLIQIKQPCTSVGDTPIFSYMFVFQISFFYLYFQKTKALKLSNQRLILIQMLRIKIVECLIVNRK